MHQRKDSLANYSRLKVCRAIDRNDDVADAIFQLAWENLLPGEPTLDAWLDVIDQLDHEKETIGRWLQRNNFEATEWTVAQNTLGET